MFVDGLLKVQWQGWVTLSHYLPSLQQQQAKGDETGNQLKCFFQLCVWYWSSRAVEPDAIGWHESFCPSLNRSSSMHGVPFPDQRSFREDNSEHCPTATWLQDIPFRLPNTLFLWAQISCRSSTSFLCARMAPSPTPEASTWTRTLWLKSGLCKTRYPCS